MEIYKIVGIGILATIVILILQETKAKEYTILISLAAGILIFFSMIDNLSEIIKLIENLIDKSNVNIKYIKILLKIVGITYVMSIGSNICKDAGQNSLAEKIEMAGKIYIVSLSIPIIGSTIELIGELI